MSLLIRSGPVMKALMATALLVATGGHANAQTTPLQRFENLNTSRRTGIDPRTLETQQRRQDFQNSQQRFRIEDRNTVQTPLKLPVPKVQPRCQPPLDGNKFIRPNC